ncbi:MAG: DUF5916 domain-containing protein [bacterium]
MGFQNLQDRRRRTGTITRSILWAIIGVVVSLSGPTFSQQKSDVRPEDYILRASEIALPIKIDGKLDDEAWSLAAPADDFAQYEPFEGKVPSEKTEVRVVYDRNNLYLGITCFDSLPDKIVATEMRRDSRLEKNDRVTLIFDTFHDHRNCFFFSFNPLGARVDGIVTDEGRDINRDWDGVWYCATSIDDRGWCAELAIPFRTLRFQQTEEQTWGFNVVRLIRRKNEMVSWTPLLRDYGFMASFKISRIGHLTGLKGLRQRNTIQVKPYLLGSAERDYREGQAKGDGDVGFDLKYSLSSNLIADVTINTDFAQVEADEVQVNLSRFSLFFPETRDLFLEGAGIFRLGERRPGPGGGTPSTILFFSRRIGLAEDTPLPILGGLKMTGKIGGYHLGLLNLQVRRTDVNDDNETIIVPASNFTALRLKRDILEKSTVGMILLNKQVNINSSITNRISASSSIDLSSDYEHRYNRVLGLDANFAFLKNLNTGGFVAKSYTPGLNHKDWSHYGYFDWRSDLWNINLTHLNIEDNFNPEMGFVPRADTKKTQVNFGFSPRPNIPFIRKTFFFTDNAWYHNQHRALVTKDNMIGIFNLLENGGYFFVGQNWNFERIIEENEFEIREEQFIIPDNYRSKAFVAGVQTDRSRTLAGEVIAVRSDFYDGKITALEGELSFTPDPHLSIETSFEYNRVTDLPVLSSKQKESIDFTTTLIRSRLNYSFSPDLYTRALVQWNSDTEEFSVNFLLNWIYQPGSDVYVVYNEFWEGNSRLKARDRVVIVKLAHLFQL